MLNTFLFFTYHNHINLHSTPQIFHLYRNYIVQYKALYEGWNFNSGNYLFTTDTK